MTRERTLSLPHRLLRSSADNTEHASAYEATFTQSTSPATEEEMSTFSWRGKELTAGTSRDVCRNGEQRKQKISEQVNINTDYPDQKSLLTLGFKKSIKTE